MGCHRTSKYTSAIRLGTGQLTHRQTALYIHAMALVRLGDASVAAYERGMKIIKDIISSLAEFDEQRDGLALEDRPSGGDSAAVVTADNGAGDENREEAESRTTEDQQRQSSIRRTEQDDSILQHLQMQGSQKRTTCPRRGDLPKTAEEGGEVQQLSSRWSQEKHALIPWA